MAPTRPDPVGTPTTFRSALEQLASAQKGAQGAPAYSRFVNRRLGRLLAALAHRAGLSPNTVTAISAAWTATGIAVLALVPPSWTTGLVVAGCLVLGYALDSADGQVARLRGGGSPAGEWLDHVVDAVKSVGVHLAVLVAWYRFEVVDAGAWLLVPIGFCVVDSVTYFATMLNESLRSRHGVATRAQPSDQRPGVGRSLLTLPTDYGLLACAFVLHGASGAFVWAYTLLFLAAGAFLALASVKWFREMGRLPR